MMDGVVFNIRMDHGHLHHLSGLSFHLSQHFMLIGDLYNDHDVLSISRAHSTT
jgi:hypothetical protein